MITVAGLFHDAEHDSRKLALTFAFSLACHLVFFSFLVFSPSQLPRKRFLPSVVDVSLVSLASPGPPAGAKADGPPSVRSKKAVKKTAPAPSVSPLKTKAVKTGPTEKVSVTPKRWKAKASLKKKTFKPDAAVKSAIKQIEKKAEETRPDPLATAFERLRDKVGAGAPAGAKADRRPTVAAPSGAGTGGGRSGGGGSGILAAEILVYQQEISYHIRNNWVFSEELAGSKKDLEVLLVIKIMANGRIQDLWFEKRSGNRHLDESARRAVMKSDPLPPLPKGYQLYNVGLIFTPSGLQ